MAWQLRRAALALTIAFGAAVLAGADDKKPDDKTPAEKKEDKEDKKEVLDAHTIMHEGHKGDKKKKTKSLLDQVKDGVKEKKWDDIQKPAKRIKAFGEALGTIDPEKGSKESWKKFTDAYKKNTADIATSVEKKDEKKAKAALEVMGKSCAGCHKEHRG